MGGACVNSTNGFIFYTVPTSNDIQNIWYLMEEAKHDMEFAGELLDSNVLLAQGNFQKILDENNVEFCFNTNNIQECA